MHDSQLILNVREQSFNRFFVHYFSIFWEEKKNVFPSYSSTIKENSKISWDQLILKKNEWVVFFLKLCLICEKRRDCWTTSRKVRWRWKIDDLWPLPIIFRMTWSIKNIKFSTLKRERCTFEIRIFRSRPRLSKIFGCSYTLTEEQTFLYIPL